MSIDQLEQLIRGSAEQPHGGEGLQPAAYRYGSGAQHSEPPWRGMALELGRKRSAQQRPARPQGQVQRPLQPEALRPVLDAYRYVVIDCPPSLGLLTINALAAVDRVLVPLQCEFYALEGLTHLLKTVKLVRERLNPRVAIEGIVLTMFDGRTSLALQIRDEVHHYFPGEIFETVIPRNVRLTEAPSHGRPVMLHDLRSSGSMAYLDLTREVIRHE